MLQIFSKVSELLRFDIVISAKLHSGCPIHIQGICERTEGDHRFVDLLHRVLNLCDGQRLVRSRIQSRNIGLTQISLKFPFVNFL
jgi:hypothetical protein